jgi:hypothetical protein
MQVSDEYTPEQLKILCLISEAEIQGLVSDATP